MPRLPGFCYDIRMKCDLDSSVPDWLIEHPEARGVFRRLGIDEACGGKSLRYLCNQLDYSPPDILAQLQQAIGNDPVE